MFTTRIKIDKLKEYERALINLARYAWRKQTKKELEIPPLRLIELAKKGELK